MNNLENTKGEMNKWTQAQKTWSLGLQHCPKMTNPKPPFSFWLQPLSSHSQDDEAKEKKKSKAAPSTLSTLLSLLPFRETNPPKNQNASLFLSRNETNLLFLAKKGQPITTKRLFLPPFLWTSEAKTLFHHLHCLLKGQEGESLTWVVWAWRVSWRGRLVGCR